ncbi:hypothetical protein A0J61_03701 [Choanephora cucurbitarum]|uniref:Uncharacterized protein n=1 Tax=Choanephora cucurbitarum TaxID=101091 RepID=A0A1C7NGM2_9FUNG|nr:hypothetical protein A0J61_03701 [Choanephora cucurbitarum]
MKYCRMSKSELEEEEDEDEDEDGLKLAQITPSPASPVPSEQSSATLDEDMIYSPIDCRPMLKPNDHWYPSFHFPPSLPQPQPQHTPHTWLPPLCKEPSYYRSFRVNTIFLNCQPYDFV